MDVARVLSSNSREVFPAADLSVLKVVATVLGLLCLSTKVKQEVIEY